VLSLLQLARQGSLVGSTCEHLSLAFFLLSCTVMLLRRNIFWYTNHAISWVNARQVDFADELDGGWLIGILVAAVHLEGVDSILVDALKKHLSASALSKRSVRAYVGRTKYCAIPVGHQQVISLCEAVGTCL
jgi:hypothetical protein